MQAHIDRTHAVKPGFNAVVVDLSKPAIGGARAADRAKAQGAPLGTLHCVPVTIKINIDVESRPTPTAWLASRTISRLATHRWSPTSSRLAPSSLG
jgi:amidase